MTRQIDEILLVESDPATAELYQRELSHAYHVFTCADEQAVIDILNTRPIRAIVLEPALNSGTGWHILTAIRALVCDRSIPIIVCSTLDQGGRGMDWGIAAYLVKPTLPMTLRETLRRVIEPR